MSLSSELYNNLRRTLLTCSNEFNSNEQLRRTVFVSELRIYRNKLSDGNDLEDRVDLALDFVLELYTQGNQLVPIHFLTILCDRYKDNSAVYQQLRDFRCAVRHELDIPDEYVSLPFVVVAMTHDQAVDLAEGRVFDDFATPLEKKRFAQLSSALFKKQKQEQLLSHYNETPEDWQPHIYSDDSSISKIIDDAVTGLNQYYRWLKSNSLLSPDLSVAFLATDYQKRLVAWNRCKLGCVMIVDALSLFHPAIYRRVLQSELSSNDRVAIAILTLPDDSSEANVVIEEEIKARLQWIRWRFERRPRPDQLCELMVRGPADFERWLDRVIPDVAAKRQQIPNPGTLEYMQKKINGVRGTMGDIISSQRGW